MPLPRWSCTGQAVCDLLRQNYQPRVGGVLYNKLRDDIKTVSPDTADAALEAAKEMKADGVVVLDHGRWAISA